MEFFFHLSKKVKKFPSEFICHAYQPILSLISVNIFSVGKALIKLESISDFTGQEEGYTRHKLPVKSSLPDLANSLNCFLKKW